MNRKGESPTQVKVVGIVCALVAATALAFCACTMQDSPHYVEGGKLEVTLAGDLTGIDSLVVYFWPTKVPVDDVPDPPDGGEEDAGGDPDQGSDPSHSDVCYNCKEMYDLDCSADTPLAGLSELLQDFSHAQVMPAQEFAVKTDNKLLIEWVPDMTLVIVVAGRDALGEAVVAGCDVVRIVRHETSKIAMELVGE